MPIRVVESNRFGALDQATLDAFERSIGATLPEPYRRHLLRHNGGGIAGAARLAELEFFFGIHDGPEWFQLPDRARMLDLGIPMSMLPIGTDSCSDLILLVVSGPQRGEIWRWNHDTDPSERFQQLARDFGEYLRGLAMAVAIARKREKVVYRAFRRVGDKAIYRNKTILDLVFERGSLRMIRTLVAAGARIRPDALIEAVRNAAPNTVHYLLATGGVDVNYTIPDTGFTALMLAASRDTVEIAKVLLDHGADAAPRNRWGKSATGLAHGAQMRRLLGSKPIDGAEDE